MKNEFIPYTQALALEELGFDEPCFGYFYTENKFFDTKVKNSELDEECSIAVALYQQAFRWFREKYKYSSYIKEATKDKYRFYIEKFDEKFYNSEILTYEEAEVACMVTLINIVKKQN